MELPETVFVSRKEVCRCYGVNWYTLKKFVKAKLIHPIRLPRHKYARYLRREIVRVLKIKGG